MDVAGDHVSVPSGRRAAGGTYRRGGMAFNQGITMNILSMFRSREGAYQREFHSERFQAELNRMRRKIEGLEGSLRRINRESSDVHACDIAARALGKPRP